MSSAGGVCVWRRRAKGRRLMHIQQSKSARRRARGKLFCRPSLLHLEGHILTTPKYTVFFDGAFGWSSAAAQSFACILRIIAFDFVRDTHAIQTRGGHRYRRNNNRGDRSTFRSGVHIAVKDIFAIAFRHVCFSPNRFAPAVVVIPTWECVQLAFEQSNLPKFYSKPVFNFSSY